MLITRRDNGGAYKFYKWEESDEMTWDNSNGSLTKWLMPEGYLCKISGMRWVNFSGNVRKAIHVSFIYIQLLLQVIS